MPAFTLAEIKEQIDEVRADLKKAQENQAYTSGGPAAGMHSQRGDVRSMQARLEWLCKEYERLEARENGGAVSRVLFTRES